MTYDMKNALQRISLALQNSMSSLDECGRIAREALAAEEAREIEGRASVVTVPVLPINTENERIVEDLIRQHKRLEDYRLRETEKGLVLERRHDPSLGVKP